MIRPPIYPWCAFDDRRFLTARRTPIVPNCDPRRISVHSSSIELNQRLLSEYDRVAHDIVGVLKGEYAVAGDGVMLFDRRGACLSINFPLGASATANMPYLRANDPELRENREELYSAWDDVPLVERAAVISHIYHRNYFHFSLELIQKIRLMQDFDVDTILLPSEMVDAPFKTDLIGRAMGGRKLRLLRHAVRVRDPVIVQTHQSPEALAWLRGLYQTSSAPSGRKYYIRRAPQPGRPGNNIAEGPEFCRLLAEHGFTVVDFGGGENSIQDQINMLDGASVVLAAHGAGLTNLAYLTGPLRVIEVFGAAVLSTCYMRISADLGFDHHALISEHLDESGDILVDCEQLQALLIADGG